MSVRSFAAFPFSTMPTPLFLFVACAKKQYVSQTLCQTSSNPLSATRALLSLSPLWYGSLLLLLLLLCSPLTYPQCNVLGSLYYPSVSWRT
uniref:HDC14851 n=1 Tax=Drosophila melanogaster TaxID=7227 RepID=Q6IJI7_DROME|nr:TPA_inf: HDC14851 [Drosophila melanogaster]